MRGSGGEIQRAQGPRIRATALAHLALAVLPLLGACHRSNANTGSPVPFGVCLGPRGWRTPEVRIEPGDEVTIVVGPSGGACVSSSMKVSESPRVKRTGSNSFALEGELRLASPGPGGPMLADCGGGVDEISLGHLPAGHYVVRGATTLEFDVPMLREMSKPVCAPTAPTPAVATGSR